MFVFIPGVPPAAAFHVADSMGVYLQVECGGWTWVGDGNPQDEWLKRRVTAL